MRSKENVARLEILVEEMRAEMETMKQEIAALKKEAPTEKAETTRKRGGKKTAE